MSNEQKAVVDKYIGMDLGSGKMISVPMQPVAVVLSTESLLGDYVKGFISEVQVRNPWRGEQIALTESELLDYIGYLMDMRVRYACGENVPWQQLKVLWIPSFVQYFLSLIGVVEDREFGFKLVPTMESKSKMKFEQAVAISERLATIQDDFDMVRDGMPRSTEGNVNVMSSAIIGEYIRSYRRIEHPIHTYVAAMLNLKLKEEAALQAVYRFQYDDVAFIHTALSMTRSLF